MAIVQLLGSDTLTISGTAGVVAKLGIGITPTARLTLAASTATAGTAPLKIASGTVMGTPENGAVEYDGTYLYFTVSSSRKQVLFTDSALITVTGEPTGFENRTDSSLAFSDAGPRLFTIAPLAPATTFSYWQTGVKYTKNAADSITIANTAGLHYIWYVGATLFEDVNFPGFDKPVVAFVYWDGTKSLNLCDERHNLTMDWSTHEYLHDTIGTRYQSGFTAQQLATGTGGADADAQVSITDGKFHDEDIEYNVQRSATPTLPFYQELGLSTSVAGKFPIYYRISTGSNNWTADAATDYPVRSFDGTAGKRIGYNLNTAGTWSVADPGSNNFVAVYLVAINSQTQPIIAVMGQRFDNSLANAIANNNWANQLMGGAPTAEIKPIYRLIYKTNTGYANTIKAYCANVTDLRNISPLPSSSYVSTSHGALTGLTDADQHPASSIYTDTTYFNTRLSVADTTVQKALDTLDDATWITALDEDFSAESNQTLTTDGNYTIGTKVWVKGNSTGDSTAMAVTAGTGLVIIPAQTTSIGGATFTAPYLRISLTTLIPNFTLYTPLRLTMYVSAENLSASQDFVVQVIANHTSLTDFNLQSGLNFVAARGVTDKVTMGGIMDLDQSVADASSNVVVSSASTGLIGMRHDIAAMVYSAWPIAPASLVPKYRYQMLSGQPTMAAASNYSLLLSAGRGGSGTALSVTIKKVMLRYLPIY